MKKFLLILLTLLALNSCEVNKVLIGDINMISERNIDSDREYVELKRYAGTGKKAARVARAKNLQDAVDATVKGVPGGEFIKNAKIFKINGVFYLVEGDVWGVENSSFAGFSAGDRVLYKKRGAFLVKDIKGTIQSLINDRECLVLPDGEDIPKKISYDDLIKIKLKIVEP